MDVRICEKKCELKDECKEFLAYYNSKAKEVNFQITSESQTAQMGI